MFCFGNAILISTPPKSVIASSFALTFLNNVNSIHAVEPQILLSNLMEYSYVLSFCIFK